MVKLVVLEPLYEHCPSDLRIWLVDKKPEDLQSAGQLANDFVDSRSGGGTEESEKNKPTTVQRESHPGTPQRGNVETLSPGEQPAPGPTDWLTGTNGLSKSNPHRVNWVGTQPEEGQASQAHGASSLPTAQEGGVSQTSFAGGLDAPDSRFSVYRVGAGLSLRSKCLVPLEVDRRKVNGYWDTGAEVPLAQLEMVAPDRVLPNTYLTLTGMSGTPFKVPVARVHLKWGAMEGPKDMGVHHHLPTKVLMGGDLEDWLSNPQNALVVSQSQRGALCPDIGEGTSLEVQDPTLVGRECTGTRLRGAVASDPASEREQAPIPSPAAEFQAELQKDPSLQKLRDLAGLSVAQTMGRGCQERFLWEKGFLYQEWASPGEVESWGPPELSLQTTVPGP
ncbi:uncharacterized protein LOC142071823 [Caretta caretta]|uniref:uncharacterized protein LOC142071823 n=1 Tax=Caretta caretta TaxID=8467 RepID=UPI003F4C66FE